MKKCSIISCPRKYWGLGFCQLHWRRFKTYKDPLFTKINPWGVGNISNGYRYIYVKGKKKSEHRYIMEQHLGRKLTKDEVIHHINNNPLDNRIENLKLYSSDAQHHKIEPYKRISRCWSCKFKLPKNNDRWCVKHKNKYWHKCLYKPTQNSYGKGLYP